MRLQWLHSLFNPDILFNWDSPNFLKEGDKILKEGKKIEIKSVPAKNIVKEIVEVDEDLEMN